MAKDNSEVQRLLVQLPVEPWPESSPYSSEHPPKGWFYPTNERILKSILNKRTRLVVELGSWEGASAVWIRALAPNAGLICIDHWEGLKGLHGIPDEASSRSSDPEEEDTLGKFQSNLWERRENIHLLKTTTLQGLEILERMGLGPYVDVVYVDAAHDEVSVTKDLEKTRQVCFNAVICGDDYGNWPGVTKAVNAVKDRRFWADQNAYRLDKIRQRREKVITSVHYNRAAYTKKSLEYLAKCDGIEDYLLLVFMEPLSEDVASDDEVLRAIHDFDACEVELFINPRVLGCNNNTLQALRRGFEITDYLILLEDDILFSRDALKYCEFCDRRYKEEPEVLTVGLYNQRSVKVERVNEIIRYEGFSSYGMATWKDRYEAWMQSLVLDPGKSWDVSWSLSAPGPLCHLIPHFSRAQNIGAHRGVHVPSPQWHAENVEVKCWAGDFPELSVREFREI